MAKQVLSQEEIDALLGAMEDGSVDIEKDDSGKLPAREYDLVGQSAAVKDEFHALNELYDRFAVTLRHRISTDLQTEIEFSFNSAEIIRFRELIQSFSSPILLNIFQMDPLFGSAVLSLESGLVFYLVDSMLGGLGKPMDQARDFTLIEQRMMRRFSLEVLKEFEDAWADIYPVSISIRKTETKPKFLHIAQPNDMIMLMNFAVKAGDFSSTMHISMPYLMLEPIKEKLSASFRLDKDAGFSWRPQIENLLKSVPVRLTAELGQSVRTARDILKLKINDIFTLGSGPEDTVALTVEGITKFHGMPGMLKGNRALEITRTSTERQGKESSHGGT